MISLHAYIIDAKLYFVIICNVTKLAIDYERDDGVLGALLLMVALSHELVFQRITKWIGGLPIKTF